MIKKLKNKEDIRQITGRQDRLRALFLFEYQLNVDDITEIWIDFHGRKVEFHMKGEDNILRFILKPDEPNQVIRPTKEDIRNLEMGFDPALYLSLSGIFLMYQDS